MGDKQDWRVKKKKEASFVTDWMILVLFCFNEGTVNDPCQASVKKQ